MENAVRVVIVCTEGHFNVKSFFLIRTSDKSSAF